MLSIVMNTALVAVLGAPTVQKQVLPRPTDEQVRSFIQEALRLDPAIDSSAMRVQVEDGIVTLAGSCANLSTKDRAVLESALDPWGVRCPERPEGGSVGESR